MYKVLLKLLAMFTLVGAAFAFAGYLHSDDGGLLNRSYALIAMTLAALALAQSTKPQGPRGGQ